MDRPRNGWTVLPRCTQQMAFAAEWLLLMYTDGIKRRFDAQPLLETAPGGDVIGAGHIEGMGSRNGRCDRARGSRVSV